MATITLGEADYIRINVMHCRCRQYMLKWHYLLDLA